MIIDRRNDFSNCCLRLEIPNQLPLVISVHGNSSTLILLQLPLLHRFRIFVLRPYNVLLPPKSSGMDRIVVRIDVPILPSDECCVDLLPRRTYILQCENFNAFECHHERFSFQIIAKNWDKTKKKSQVVDRLKSLVLSSVPQILVICGGYLITGIIFLIFIIANRGIVLGDRDAHTSVFHLSQVLYFSLFTAIFGFPWVATRDNVKQFCAAIAGNKLKTVFASSIIVGSLYLSCHVHPYTLADNRHYTFYFWRRYLGCPTSLSTRQMLYCPLYAFSLYTIISMLRTKDVIWKYLFSLCLCLSIVPPKTSRIPILHRAFHFMETEHSERQSSSTDARISTKLFCKYSDDLHFSV